jgi:uncharacterized membrane protein YczE
VAFRWSYTVLQAGGALAGWALGAAVGPGTIVTALLVGPAVDLARRTLFRAPRATDASPPAVAQPAAEPC